MGKKYLGKNPLNTLMGIVLDVMPSKELSEEDTKSLWEDVINPPKVIEVAPDGALSNWDYTLDDASNSVTLNKYTGNQYTGSKIDVIVYGRYQLNGKIYDTKIGSNPTNSTYMFAKTDNIRTITFNEGIDTSNVTSMSYMFFGCESLIQINGLEYFDTSNVTSMYCMFSECELLRSLDITSFDTSNVTNMSYMFH